MSVRANDVEEVAIIQSDLLTLKNGSLNLDLSNPPIPSPPKRPFTPQTPSTPLLIRQSSTSFQASLVANCAVKKKKTCLSILNDQNDTGVTNYNENINNKAKNSIEIGQTTAINDGIQIDQKTTNDISSDTDYESFSDEDVNEISDHELLLEKGYKVTRKICNTSQGCMYEGVILEPTTYIKRIAIKKTEKYLYSKRISRSDGDNNLHIITNENIIKEAIILHHLTVDNKATADYIVCFVDFFEGENGYFLVMEYGGDCTLNQFCDEAFEYMQQGKLDLKEWKRIVKYIMWQIVVITYFMHHDMNTCHLDLNMDNLLVQNGTFIQNENGQIAINPNIHIKLKAFGLSEVFSVEQQSNISNMKQNDDEKDDDDEFHVYEYDPFEVDWENVDKNPFYCLKFGLRANQYSAPKIWIEEPYDARKSDIWSIGIILFRLSTGVTPYINADSKTDSGYWCIKHNNIRQYLEMNDLSKYISNTLLILINGCLNMDETERYLINDIIHHQWFKNYYSKYKERIENKSISQIERQKAQQKKMKLFPFYVHQ